MNRPQWWRYEGGQWSVADELPWTDDSGQPDGYYVAFNWADDMVELLQPKGDEGDYLVSVCLDASIPYFVLVASLPDLLSLLNWLAPLALTMLADGVASTLQETIWNVAEDGLAERRRRYPERRSRNIK